MVRAKAAPGWLADSSTYQADVLQSIAPDVRRAFWPDDLERRVHEIISRIDRAPPEEDPFSAGVEALLKEFEPPEVAAEVVSEDVDAPRQETVRAIPGLSLDYLVEVRDPDPDIARAAVSRLAAVGSPRALDGVVSALQHNDVSVRAAALKVLRRRYTSSFRGAIEQRLLDVEQERPRARAGAPRRARRAARGPGAAVGAPLADLRQPRQRRAGGAAGRPLTPRAGAMGRPAQGAPPGHHALHRAPRDGVPGRAGYGPRAAGRRRGGAAPEVLGRVARPPRRCAGGRSR